MGNEAKALRELEKMFNTTMQVDDGRHVPRFRTIDETERAQDAGLKREHAKETANDAWVPHRDRPVIELTEHQLRLHDKATGRAYYLGRPTDAQIAVQRRQIEHRMALLGAKHGAIPGQRPIYSEHQRYGAAYVTAWEAARGTSSDALFADLFGKRRQCDHCCKWYGYERSTAQYCSADCRVNASRGAYRKPEPAFRCDEIFEIPSAPIAIPARVPSHDQLCLSRRAAINDHIS
jgi:hypothetical protein